MKKIYTGILLAAIILLPTCFAILSFTNAQSEPVQTSSVTSLKLIAPDGTALQFDAKEKEDSEFIHFFIELNNNAHSVEKLPSDLKDAACYEAVYVSRSEERAYRYYFSSTKPSSSYYEDDDGNAFRIDAADTIAFLDSDYSGGLYAYSKPPKLSADGTVIEPDHTLWDYYTYSNIKHTVNSDNQNTPTLTASYDDFQLQFDTFPDESSLKITDENGEVLYSGSYADYIKEAQLKKFVRKDMQLHYELSAKWAHNEALGYGGEASYAFDLQVIFDPHAVFWLGEESVELGDFVVLSGKYVENLDELSVTASPSIEYEPKFFTDGEYVRALIPISQDLAEGVGDYELQINYMGILHTLKLKVKPTAYADTIKRFCYTGLRTSARTESAVNAFAEHIASLPYEASPLFSGPFVMNSGESVRAEFGNTIDNTEDRDDRFRSNGVAFVAYKGTQIHAVNNGKVISIGTTAYGGNTVVIDHGLGLRSVYYCIRNVTVSVGDTVTTGALIGTGACAEGYTDGYTAYCELWVGDVPVSYYPLTESGRNGMIVYGEDVE